MPQTARLFSNGNSQAVRLPLAFRFTGSEVHIRRNPDTHEVILSEKPQDWDSFFAAAQNTDIPGDFLAPEQSAAQERDPFAGWHE